MVKRILILPVLILIACLLAGLYGALHNQISYTVGPDYFHAFKFIQFRIPPDLQGRIGAAIVGWFASWWMGLIIGTPLALLCLALPNVPTMIRSFLGAALVVFIVTLTLGSLSLMVALPPEQYNLFRIPAGVENEAEFIRAAVMHEISYGAGLVGLVLGLIFIGFSIRKSRRASQN